MKIEIKKAREQVKKFDKQDCLENLSMWLFYDSQESEYNKWSVFIEHAVEVLTESEYSKIYQNREKLSS